MRRLAPLLVLALVPRAASAHVKWFSDFRFTDPPLTFSGVLTPTFWALLTLSVVALGALALLDARLDRVAAYQRITTWLALP